MRLLSIKNPFGAPVYHEDTVSSTMDAARALAEKNEAHGTVITADFQDAGRGRSKRLWSAERGKNLLFTILLRYRDFSGIPTAITLRTGLAVSMAVKDFAPGLAVPIQVKWPNDVMIASRKLLGILTEANLPDVNLPDADGGTVFIGVGVNVAQKDFPDEHRAKAGSLAQFLPAPDIDIDEDARFLLLEKILFRLYQEIEEQRISAWRERLTQQLYKMGENVIFAEGAAASQNLIEGRLSGIGPEGELLLIPKGEETERAFVSGELKVY